MPEPKVADLAELLAEQTKKALAAHKVETAAELKGLVDALVAEKMGTGSNEFKSLAALVAKEVMAVIPQGSVFDPANAKNIDTSAGFAGMSKKALDELGRRVLFAVTPKSLHEDLFPGLNAKALSVQVGATGGFTLPEEFVAEVARKLVHQSVFLGSCRVWNGVSMMGKLPRETGTVNVTIGNELVTPAQTGFTLGNLTWQLQKRMALTQLPQELWKFSGIDILGLLATMFAEQFQKTEDYYYLLGSGSQQPMGLLSQTSGMNAVTMASGQLQWADLLTLKHSIKSQYRNAPGCVFMMNNDTIRKVSGLTDDQNRPVFIDRGSEGMGSANVPPQTVGFLLGYPVLENPYTPGPVAEALNSTTNSAVASKATIIFSNLQRGYYAFKGQTMEVKTSDVAYDAFLNDGLYTRAIDFFDGKPAIPEATALLTGVA